ncbi:hypothetical protein AB0I81_52020 [Nonomuraea sp. NPDC050404]|uniref:hypothetical protein n=1 Tax=Nonomuraea sp. NPDC050404 TaxID=3155783 RepID=UPI0033CC2099
MIKRALTIATAALVTAGVLAGTPEAASAASGCSGQQIRHWVLDDSRGLPISTIRLYYNARTGINCAVNVWRPGTRGKRGIHIGIWTAKSGWKRDEGSFKYYAGPVRVYGKHRCVRVSGWAQVGRYRPTFDSGRIACR